MAKSTTDIQNEVIENFSLFEDDMESRLFYLMDLGKKLPSMPDEHKTEDYIVKGCQSKVWLFPRFENEKIYFEADSNTEITKGLVYLLVNLWNGRSADEILTTELYFIDKFWPDFNKEDIFEAILNFQQRERRFGKTSEQIKN